MAYLQCNITVSWRTQLIASLLSGGLIVVILLLPWSGQHWPIWCGLVILIAIEAVLVQRRIRKTKGVIALHDKNTLYWQEDSWHISRLVFQSRFGVLFSLLSQSTQKKNYLWLASDSMAPEEWRRLCYELHTQ